MNRHMLRPVPNVLRGRRGQIQNWGNPLLGPNLPPPQKIEPVSALSPPACDATLPERSPRAMSSRRDAREQVMKALYAHEQTEGDAGQALHTLVQIPLDDDPSTRDFAERLFRETLDTMDEADEIIQKHADNWEIHRIAVIDRCLLRMATTELLNFEEIPPKVSVDEAIEIAKEYSTPRSGTFVNGVIDAVLLDLHEQERLNKSGRGLIGMDTIRDRADSS